LQRWEKGQFEPDQKTTIIIADFFNVSIDYLFGRED
ncbi:MAG: helix-turn-helix domain-containing protein, partial [Anaeroplasmataceae bacterium]|nr:helix-turn-helix domain-containing protein [Anaeroplasmataceae bacterium]